MTSLRTSLALIAIGVLGACSEGASVVGRGDATVDDIALDLPDANVPIDRPVSADGPAADAVDAPSPDGMDVMDAPDDADAARRCGSADDCRGDPAGSACDTASGRCVECVAAADTCAPASHCNDMTHRCEVGCRSDEGCAPMGGSDAGVMMLRARCDTTMHRCVECLTNDHCPIGTLCVGNVCAPGCTDGRGCPTGQTCCGSACVDSQSNLAHCGRCDNRCAIDHGTPACTNGTCSVGTCTAPFGDCDGTATNGCETDTRADIRHCGMCGRACATPTNATPTCDGGRCGYTCAAGFADCDLNPANGCEVDLRTDATHCGSCTTACDPPNGTAACVMGRCAVGACDMGFGDCDLNATNGCETNLRATVGHCGLCGNACPERPNAFPGCVASRCVISCVAGFADCDGDASNGCEVDTRTSRDHCGACGRSCATAGGTGTCEGSVCRLTGCDAGRGNCDGNAANGCEADLTTTLSHCGMCGNACPTRAHATATCASATCGFTCDAGYADCDRDPSNGCEAALTTSDNCGRCGQVCADATPVCTAGACVSGCATGQQRCAGVCVNPSSDPSNCGACGVACPTVAASSRVCVSGRCDFVCDAGRGNCDGSATNGCEATFATDNANCGACGRACGFGAECRSGACVSVVPPGLLAWYRFDEGSGSVVRDSSGHGYDGTHNAAYAAGRLGTAIAFNGSNRAVVPYTEGFTWGNGNADFTVEYWIYITTPPTGQWRAVTHKGTTDCATGDRTTAQWLGPGSMQIYPAISTSASCNEYFVAPALPLNTWTHFADVKAGSTHLVYINGVLALSGAVGSTVGNLGPYYIGWDPWYSGLNGRLDDLRVYTRALTATEINDDIRASGGP